MKRICLEEAQTIVYREMTPVSAMELPVMECAGLVLAEDLTAAVMQPPFARSAMDGYAFFSEDGKGASRETPVSLSIAYKTCAGDAPGRRIKHGEAVRIMTGGVIPEGADCVLRQEDTDFGESTVQIYEPAVPGQSCCQAGEDFREGDVLAYAGSCIDAYTVAAAVAAGRTSLTVRRPVKAAVITTGDELWDLGKPLEPGKIYNSNLAYLQIRLMQLGCPVVYHRSVGDEKSGIISALKEASREADFIITTGGVSVGQKDLIPHVMEELEAEIKFHGVAVKPGMPTMFSVWKGLPVLSLSGNPYSAFAVFELFMRPMLSGMLGQKKTSFLRIRTKTASSFPKSSRSRRLLRGIYDGSQVWIPEKQQNGQLTSGIGYNCLIDLPAGSDAVKMGDAVEIIMLSNCQ